MTSPFAVLWPPWRFGSNVKSASENTLEALSDGAVIAEWCFAALVVFGVGGEFVIAAIHPPYDSWLEWWGPAYADLLVAIGVVGEVLASVIAHKCDGELTRRSREQAAKAERETERLKAITAWRRVSSEQHEQIAAAIRGFVAPLDLLIEYQSSDPEAYLFAREIANIFVAAGLGKIRLGANAFLSGDVFGVRIATSPEIDGAAISGAFANAGVPMTTFKTDLSTHLSRAEVAPNLYIFVGPKPPLPHVAMASAFGAGSSSGIAISATTREPNI